ncbi:MAG: MFS transporter, partial [Acidobacteriota bacterium]
TGFGFVLLFSISGLTLARLSDKFNRVRIVGIGLAVWSALTSLTGLAGSAAQLVLARSLVGVSESVAAPATFSVLADCYPPEKRGRSMSFLSMATFVGASLAFIVGSALNQRYGWRNAFFIAGLPGLLIAALLWLTVKDPERGSTEARNADNKLVSLPETMRFLLGQKSFLLIVIGFALVNVCNQAILVWIAPFLERVHKFANAGLIVGPLVGVAGISGALIGAAIITRLAKRDVRWNVWAPAMALLLTAPVFLVICLANQKPAVFAGIAASAALSAFQVGPISAAIQGAVKVRMRAFASAIFFAIGNLIGQGFGPLIVGMVSDALRPTYGELSLRYGLLVIAVVAVVGGLLLFIGARHLLGDMERCAQIPENEHGTEI